MWAAPTLGRQQRALGLGMHLEKALVHVNIANPFDLKVTIFIDLTKLVSFDAWAHFQWEGARSRRQLVR